MNKKGKTYNLKVANLVTGKIIKCQLGTSSRLHPDNGNVVWNATFSLNDEEIRIEGEYLLSGIIDRIREAIEPHGYRILVRCSDLDASHSGMQGDMSAGTLIYKLKILDEINSRPEGERNNKDAEYHVLDESDLESVATLQQQKEFRKNYFTRRRLEN